MFFKLLKCVLFLVTFCTSAVFAECYITKDGCGVDAAFSNFNTKKFKGPTPALAKDPAKGLKYFTPKDALKAVKDDSFVFVDVRPPHLYKDCQIRGAVNLDWAIPGKTTNTLTKEAVKGFIDQGKTVIFYCNALKCYRSLNAALQAYAWGFPAEKIKWLGKGVPGVVRTADKYRKFVKGKGCAQFKK